MFVPVSEFRANITHYLEISYREDVIITKHNKAIATVTNTDNSLTDVVGSLRGVFGVEDSRTGDEIQ